MTLSLTTDQQSTLTAVFKDANGGVIEPDLNHPLAPRPMWTEDTKGTIVVLFPSEDERTCVVVGVAPGTAAVTLTDRGTGKQVAETVVVSAGGVAHLLITASTPQRQALPEFAQPAPAPLPAGDLNTAAAPAPLGTEFL